VLSVQKSINPRTIHTGKADLVNIALIILLFIAVILFTRFYTLHPIDDDWSYIRAAETFHTTGDLKFTAWTSMSLVFQVVWGSLFSWILGFSVNNLVLSTQVVSLIGAVFLYLLLRSLSGNGEKALMFTLVVILNPFSFPLLFTFFSDHHFMALVFIAVYCFHRGISLNSSGFLVWGSLISSCAVLVRQPGLLIPAAAGLYLVVHQRAWKKALTVFLLPVITFVVFTCWFQFIHGPTYSSEQQLGWILDSLSNPLYFISKLFNRPIIILEFFGFCLIPYSLALLPPPRELFSRKNASLLSIFMLSGVLFYLIQDHVGITSSLYSWMNGFHFAFVSEYGFRGSASLLLFFYKIVDFLSLFSITFVCWHSIQARDEIKKSRSPARLMIMYIALLQLVFFFVIRYKFTRYYLLLIPFFIIIVYPSIKHLRLQKKYFYPLLAGFALFSLVGTQDFLSWNEARWNLGEKTLGREIAPTKLSGGFPWDCWHNMDYCTDHPDDIVPHAYDIPWWFEELLPAMDPQYLISNSPVPTGFYYLRYFYTDSYTIEDTASYFSLLYLKDMKIFLLKRKPVNDAEVPGTAAYRFIDNLAGAEKGPDDETNKHTHIRKAAVSINDNQQRVLVQPAETFVAFRLSLPPRKCRLNLSLATDPATWDAPGDGVMFRIMLRDNLLENLYDSVGMVGAQQKIDFLKPRSYFFGFRNIYTHYLDPKKQAAQRAWHPVCLDLSRFSGKVVDLSFVIGPGPGEDEHGDVALWGDPVIETY